MRTSSKRKTIIYSSNTTEAMKVASELRTLHEVYVVRDLGPFRIYQDVEECSAVLNPENDPLVNQLYGNKVVQYTPPKAPAEAPSMKTLEPAKGTEPPALPKKKVFDTQPTPVGPSSTT